MVVALAAVLLSPAFAETTDLPLNVNGSSLRPSVRSWQALRQDHVVMQQLDYSCGAAALATLFRHYFAVNIDEATVLEGILGQLGPDDVAERERNGLSLLDLKSFAQARGFQAVGVRLRLTSLSNLRGPVLVHLAQEGYGHFAVLKGVQGDRVWLADPSRGNVRLPVARFAREWTGVALVLGRPGMPLPERHALRISAEGLQDEMLAAVRVLSMPR